MGQRSYVIVGVGAVGGYYGGRLAHAGLDVHLLLHSDHAVVKQRGLIVESIHGDFSIRQPKAWVAAREVPPCDVAVVALKSTRNHLLPAILPHVLKPDGVVLMLQNGLGVDEDAAAVVGPDRVLGGLCFLCSNKVGPGHIKHLDYGDIALGQFQGSAGAPGKGTTAAMRQVAADFTRAGINVRLAEDLDLARWQKLVWNIPYNGLSVLLDADTQQMMSHRPTVDLVEALMQEVVAGAAACGRTVTQEFVRARIEHTERMAPYLTSMLLDRRAGRAMELRAIFEVPLGRGLAGGAAMPRIDTLWRQLQFLER